MASAIRIVFRSGFVSHIKGARKLATTIEKGTSKSKSGTTVVKEPDFGNVPGLSSAVVSIPSGEVGPHASKQTDYKNPEYFCYNEYSYFEAEIEMLKYRLPQPSSMKSN